MRTLAHVMTATTVLGLVLSPVASAQSQARMSRAEAEHYVTTTYAQLTRATQYEMEASFVAPLNRMTAFEGTPYLDVDPCSDEYGDVVSEDDGQPETTEVLLLRSARYYTSIRETLRRNGYPTEAFAPLLEARERANLEEKIAHLAGETRVESYRVLTEEEVANNQSLDVELEAVRQRVAPGLPPIRAITGCGGVESPTFIRANPPGAQVWIISSFRFNYCRALDVDPWRPETCHNWVLVQPQQRHNVVGTFLYIARWLDGRTGNGRGNITPNAAQTDQEFIVVPGQMP